MSDGRRLWVICLFAAWFLTFGYSFVAFWTTPAEGEGFVRGMNRPLVYLGWQGIAGMIAVALWGVGRGWPKGASTRQLTAVPLVLGLLQVAGIIGIIAWARFG